MADRGKRAISAFVAAWLLVFNYESIRYKVLAPLLGREPPKLKFLFPPAGWIMFFSVDEADGHVEVYGIRPAPRSGGVFRPGVVPPPPPPELIDPHRIFATRWVGYDNIRRNVLITALEPAYGPEFCGYLRRKFPEYETFAVAEAWTPSVVKEPDKKLYRIAYKC